MTPFAVKFLVIAAVLFAGMALLAISAPEDELSKTRHMAIVVCGSAAGAFFALGVCYLF